MIRFFIIIFIVFLATHLHAQKTRIEKIHDSNLFELEDETLIKLTGVDVPSTNHPDSALSAMAGEIIDYVKTTFPYGYVNVKYDPSDYGAAYRKVYLTRDNLFYTVDYNKLFLEWGYGRLIRNEVDSLRLQSFAEAEAKAKNNSYGIWELNNFAESDTLDRCANDIKPCLNLLLAKDTIKIYDRGIGRLTAELVLAPAAGVVFSFISAGLSSALLGGSESWGYAILGLHAGYTIGTSWGVYIIAQGGNEELSMPLTIGAGLLGGAAAIAIFEFDYWDTDESLIPYLAAPLITSMIYANLIAPFPDNDKIQMKHEEISFNKPMNHNDYFNAIKSLDMQLVRIAL